jgi:flagella basal body P-ring formation protein FlgA
MMRRSLTFAATLALSIAFAAPAAADPAAAPVSLRNAARIVGTQVTIGDLFDNAGPHAGDVVATAPALGTSLLFEATWLESTARTHGLTWQPPSGETAIRVQRAARTIDDAELVEKLAAVLNLAQGKTKLALDSQYRIDVPVGSEPGYSIEHAEINAAAGRFTAALRIPADDPAAPVLRVSGRLVAMVEVPVLARAMMPGETVAKADVTWAELPAAAVPPGDVTDLEEMIGRTPRHPLQAGLPLRPTDLQIPIVVKRNDAVLIVLERPGLYLTAEGKALDDGGKDTVIRVVNIQSNRTIDAVVLGSGQVAVRPPSTQQAAVR